MLNLAELERRWLRYKIKSLFPYIGGGITLVGVVIIVGLSLSKEENKNLKNTQPLVEKTLKQNTITKTQHIKTPIKTQHTPAPKTTTIDDKDTTVLEPSMHFLSMIQYKAKNTLPTHTTAPQIESQKPKKQIINPNYTIEERETKTANYINIKRRDTNNDIQEIVKRFKKNHNPALSLFIAKKYYEIGNYKKAYNYALITNQINEDIEDSWIIFAKSLVKMDKKTTAIKTLKEYIKYSQSSSAQILLNEILSGKFR